MSRFATLIIMLYVISDFAQLIIDKSCQNKETFVNDYGYYVTCDDY